MYSTPAGLSWRKRTGEPPCLLHSARRHACCRENQATPSAILGSRKRRVPSTSSASLLRFAGKRTSPGRRSSATAGAVIFRNQSLPGALSALLSILPTLALATRTTLKHVVDSGFVDSPATFTTKLPGALSGNL